MNRSSHRSGAPRHDDRSPAGHLKLIHGGSGAPAESPCDPEAETAGDLQRQLSETLTRYAVLDRELRSRLPNDVMRLVDALTDATHDIAVLESAIGVAARP